MKEFHKYIVLLLLYAGFGAIIYSLGLINENIAIQIISLFDPGEKGGYLFVSSVILSILFWIWNWGRRNFIGLELFNLGIGFLTGLPKACAFIFGIGMCIIKDEPKQWPNIIILISISVFILGLSYIFMKWYRHFYRFKKFIITRKFFRNPKSVSN